MHSPNMMGLWRLIQQLLPLVLVLLLLLLLVLVMLLLTLLGGSLFGYTVVADDLLEHLNLQHRDRGQK